MHEGAEIGRLGGALHVGIFQHDQRILAAQLDAALLEMGAGLGSDLPANGGRAGERDALDIGVLDQLVTDLRHMVTRAGDDVEDALGQARLLEDFGEQEAAQIGGFLGGLEHDGVAGSEREEETACRENAGKIPRADDRDNAHRATDGHRHLAVVGGQHLAGGLPDRRRGGVEDFSDIAGFEHALAEPAAALGLDRVDDVHLALFPDFGGLVQHVGALGERQLGPFGESGVGRLDRGGGFRASGIWHLGPDRPVGRVGILEGPAGGGPVAADIHACKSSGQFRSPC